MEDGLGLNDFTSLQCFHPSFMDNNCTWCNKHISECGDPATTPFRYIHPRLTLSLDEINRVRDDNLQYLLDRKRLHLVLDLDNTLVHARATTSLTAAELEIIETTDDVCMMFGGAFVVKLRPGVKEFIEKVSSMFDLSIYTMGSRGYAQGVHRLLVAKAGFPSCAWVIAREDCVKEKQKRLDVVLSHEKVVVIVDDTVRVWEKSCKKNLVNIGRYEYFPITEGGAEEADTDLAGVYDVLKKVHSEFYFDDDFVLLDGEECSPKDVRDVLDAVKYHELDFGRWPPRTVLFGQDDEDEDEDSTAMCKRSRDLLQNTCVQPAAKRSRTVDVIHSPCLVSR